MMVLAGSYGRSARIFLGYSAIAIAIAGCFAAGPAAAADRAFDIAAQPLSQAILKLSDQANVVIIAPSSLVEGKQSPAIHGPMSAENALNKLLDGTGLKAVTGSDGVITVQAASPERSDLGNSDGNRNRAKFSSS